LQPMELAVGNDPSGDKAYSSPFQEKNRLRKKDATRSLTVLLKPLSTRAPVKFRMGIPAGSHPQIPRTKLSSMVCTRNPMSYRYQSPPTACNTATVGVNSRSATWIRGSVVRRRYKTERQKD